MKFFNLFDHTKTAGQRMREQLTEHRKHKMQQKADAAEYLGPITVGFGQTTPEGLGSGEDDGSGMDYYA